MHSNISGFRVSVLGAGYWGKKLIRNFIGTGVADVIYVAEVDATRREEIRGLFPPVVSVLADPVQAIEAPDIDATVIATPAETHYMLARRALEAKKHVLVEKPLALRSEHYRELIALAHREHRLLMVDHTFLYTDAIAKAMQIVRSGELGRLLRFDSLRLDEVSRVNDVGVLFDLAPHDFSILDCLNGGELPEWVSSNRIDCATGHEREVLVTMSFESGLFARTHLSWQSSVRKRFIAVTGEAGRLVWDDTLRPPALRVYNYRDDTSSLEPLLDPDSEAHDFQVVEVEGFEALSRLVEVFVYRCRNVSSSVSHAEYESLLRIARLLDASRGSLTKLGARIEP